MQSFTQTFGLHTMLLASLTNLTKWIQAFLGREALLCSNRVVRARKGRFEKKQVILLSLDS